ncbi:diguanylate cyclase [Rhodobacterales bacterium]|nr:diguanylate cyclase [Rhodobacterales bacterium]
MTKPSTENGGRQGRLPRQRISRLAFLLAGLLIAVTSVSLLFVGYVASRASNRQAISHEERLFRNTLADQKRSIVRGLMSVAVSDDSVAGLVQKFDPVYARKSFKSLWSEFSFSKVVVISADSQILAESFEGYTHIFERSVDETPELRHIVEKARKLFVSNRVRIPGGFGHRSLNGVDPSEFAVMGFARIDGQPAIYGAMPVIPDEYRTALPDGPPTILVSATYLNSAQLKQLNARLNFNSFSFTEGDAKPTDGPYHPVVDSRGRLIGAFTWDWQPFDTTIWPTVIPVVVLLSTALAALAFGIAWRIGQLTRSLQASEEQNRYLALHDSLSGLANRLSFNRELETAISGIREKPIAILHCDLDKFKNVNDSHGHAAGDEVIRTISARLRRIVGELGLVCRVGGDEFMVIYRGPVSKTYLRVLCDAVLDMGRQHVPIEPGLSVSVGISIGVAIAPRDGRTAEALVAASDAALYHAKRNGRGDLAFYGDLPPTRDATPQARQPLEETAAADANGSGTAGETGPVDRRRLAAS